MVSEAVVPMDVCDLKEDILDELEDEELLHEINSLVECLQNEICKKPYIEKIIRNLKLRSLSVTTVPRSFKFFFQNLEKLKEIYSSLPEDSEEKSGLANVISFLSMGVDDLWECVKYRIVGTDDELSEWGYEYVRKLIEGIRIYLTETSREKFESSEIEMNKIVMLGQSIVPICLNNNSLLDAIDLCIELNKLEYIEGFSDESNFQRVSSYLIKCAQLVLLNERNRLIESAYKINMKNGAFLEAIRVALVNHDIPLVLSCVLDAMKVYQSSADGNLHPILAQIALFLHYNRITIHHENLSQQFLSLLHGSRASTDFLECAKNLDVLAPKTPENIFKTHTSDPTLGFFQDSMESNLTSAIVNGLINMGYGSDKLFSENSSDWYQKLKAEYLTLGIACIGLISLWDVDGSINKILEYIESESIYIKAGGIMALGIMSNGTKGEHGAVAALLSSFLESSNQEECLSAIIGIGISSAGTWDPDMLQSLYKPLIDEKSSVKMRAQCAISIGMVGLGSQNMDAISNLLQFLIDMRSELQTDDSDHRYFIIGLGLLYFGTNVECPEAVLCTLDILPPEYSRWAKLVLDICIYAGSGNVLMIQKLAKICSLDPISGFVDEFATTDMVIDETTKDNSEKSVENNPSSNAVSVSPETPKPDNISKNQAANERLQELAVLGIAIIAKCDPLTVKMCQRLLLHMIQYGSSAVKSFVTFGLAILSASNPEYAIIASLTKLANDSNSSVSHNAITSLGIVGAGTNNARIATVLRHFVPKSVDYGDKKTQLAKTSLGLVYSSKGLVTLNPSTSDGILVNRIALASLFLFSAGHISESKSSLSNKAKTSLFWLVPAFRPKYLMTFDENLKPFSTMVKIGQSLDPTGQVGALKNISKFQTFSTPALICHGERAELVNDKYISLNSILEGHVILKENPEYQEE